MRKEGIVVICFCLLTAGAWAQIPPMKGTIEAAGKVASQEALAANVRRAASAVMPRTLVLPMSVVLPAQQRAIEPLPLPELEKQMQTHVYSPLFLSSFLQYTRQPQYYGLLHKHLLGLSLQGAQPATEDQAVLLNQLRRDIHLQQEQLKRNAAGLPLDAAALPKPVADRMVRLASSVAGLGLYGHKKDVTTLRWLYLEWSKTQMEPLFLSWVSRALIALDAKEEARQLVEKAPASFQKAQLQQFLSQEESLPNDFSLQLDPNLSALEPVISDVSPDVSFAFDSSPATTSYYVAWKQLLSQVQPSPVQSIQTLRPQQKPELTPQMRWRQHLNRRYGRAYPSGLQDEERLIADWMEYYKNGYFKPRNQIEVIEGMSAAKANNIMEYLYYMTMPEAEELILKPLRQTGRLPEFMYTADLIPGTSRLPYGYYKNKFNENIARFVELAEEDGTIYTHNVELKDLITSMKDYTFEQGFMYRNSPELTQGLRRNWEALVTQIDRFGVRADRRLLNKLWKKPVRLPDGTMVSLRDYFTQTRHSFASDMDVTPSFYLNSPKWVAWENQRRNLRAQQGLIAVAPEEDNFVNRMQRRWALGSHPEDYLTLEQFANVMRVSYLNRYGASSEPVRVYESLADMSPAVMGIRDEMPSSTTIKVNNFDKLGGVCQMSFGDGGYMGPVRPGYDGTSTVDRFEPQTFQNVRVVVFDVETLQPRIVTLDKVSYLKDLKKPDINQVRASTMVSDGLDLSRDLLTVQREEQSLQKIPHLRATIYPKTRITYTDKIPYMYGGGLAGYLALFTPDFYPLKEVKLLRRVNGKLQWVTQYYVRKEVAALAGMIHRERLTFTPQVQERIVSQEVPVRVPKGGEK